MQEKELSKAAQKVLRERRAERAAAATAPKPEERVGDPALLEKQRANATIIPDGRTGRAYTLLKNVVPDEGQPRKARNIDPAEIVQLADSIKNGEQIQPIVVDWWPELGKWKIIVGERRWMAVQAAGLDRIACQFKFERMEPVARKLMQGVENIHRSNLTDLERAEYFRELLDMTGWNQKRLAKEVNVSESAVTRALQLLELPPAIQADVVAGKISPAAAAELTKVKDQGEQEKLHGAILSGGMNRDDVSEAVKQKKPNKRRKAQRTVRLKIDDDEGFTYTVTVAAPHAFQDGEVERVLRLALQRLGEKGQSKAA